MVQTYDPWGLGSRQSERTTQITHAAQGGIGHGLVGTRLSCVKHVLFENIFWEGLFEPKCMDTMATPTSHPP